MQPCRHPTVWSLAQRPTGAPWRKELQMSHALYRLGRFAARRPWAVLQLRREDRAGQMWNMVSFQTRLRIPEQQRVA